MPVITPSNALIDTIRFGATLVEVQLTMYTGGTPTTVVLPVSVMNITVDRSAAHRRQGSITMEVVPSVPPPSILPVDPTSLLAPFGNEVFVQMGIAFRNASGKVTVAQWVPMGMFALATTAVDDTVNDLAITIDVYDRSWTISQRSLVKPYSFPVTASGNFVSEIQALLNQVWGVNPPLTYNITPTTATVPAATYNQGSDPWQAALDMAASVGYELFFDVNGNVVGYPIPTPSTQSVTWNFTDSATNIFGAGGAESGGGSTTLGGSPYSTPAEVQSTMTRDGIFNSVYITGTGTTNAPFSNTGTSAPIVANAKDTTVGSPTNVNGPMGEIPEFASSNLATTSAQAQSMANNELLAALAAAWQITLAFSPNPIFEIDDVVTVTRPRIGISNKKMVIDNINYAVSYAGLSKITGRVIG